MTSDKLTVKISFIVCFISLVGSQTVWIDVDSGNIVGVTNKGQNQHNNGQIYNRPQYPQNQNYYGGNQRPGNSPMWNCRNSQTGFTIPISNDVMLSAFPEIIQQSQRSNFPRHNNYPHYHRRRQYDPSQYRQYEFTVRRKRSTLNPEWICTNSKTGDMLVIASEVMTNKFPVTNQNTNNPYADNPWLNNQNTGQNQPNWGQNIPTQKPDQQFPPNWNQNQPDWGQTTPTQQPGQNIDKNQPNWGQNNQNNPPIWENNQNDNTVTRPSLPVTQKPTEPPAIILTTKKPFPTLQPDIDWLQFLQTTQKPTTTSTTTTKRPSLSQAIDGEGIIMPRGGFEK